MSFLKAEWRKLAFANYAIAPEILTNYVPYGTELDTYDGVCYISLVGFLFQNTKLLGLKIPFHVNFEEVNLRFYVKRFDGKEWKRGVVFIKEIVPKPALTFVANTVYNENYETMPMEHQIIHNEQELMVHYRWKHAVWNEFQVTASPKSEPIIPGGLSEFITEHYWGYAALNATKSNEYEVTHPQWNIYPVRNYIIHADFGALYGEEFAFLSNATPANVLLAEGSEITVENKIQLRQTNIVS
ncbi:hypothetical protein SAMN05216480_10654 [Pustulibacterium marinum]|uniref:DUF2071 domain-containing protein n=1 Tax=Pustulibacterium marinum TaxID=1224947 RepID=A0A1I7GWS6_9FLAO|nr:DUF2071 domain-containing protein [Pustulibacterium marinum]SFU52881.1 hypothetical protein SAMN05216480_10654 [Pustulibacterium marinum]